MGLGEAASLAWGTTVTVRAGEEHRKILVGPAHFDQRGAHLKILPLDSASATSAEKFRRANGYTAMSVAD